MLFAVCLIIASVIVLVESLPGPSRAGSTPSDLAIRRRSETEGGKVLRYPLQQAALNGTSVRRRRRAESDAFEQRSRWNWKHLEDFHGYCYFIEVEIGDPPQKVKLMPDTGSYETWVNPNCDSASNAVMCEFNGKYDPTKSQLAVAQKDSFELPYGSGWATGRYYEDRVYFRNEDVGIRQKFGVATDSIDAIAGILGLGYGNGFGISYNSILDSLVRFDFINGPVYSVGLGRQGGGSSEIVFGGINLSKYSGYLTPVPVWPSVYEQPANWVHYWVNMTSFAMTFGDDVISLYNSTKAKGKKQLNVLIDTGVTYSFLPPDVVDALAREMNAWEDLGILRVSCEWRDIPGTVNFGFNNDNLMIKVTYWDFVLKLQDGSCTMGVQKRNTDNYDLILGDTFLRGAYGESTLPPCASPTAPSGGSLDSAACSVRPPADESCIVVYDQTTHNVWMANYQECGSQVQEVGRRPYDVQQYKGLC